MGITRLIVKLFLVLRTWKKFHVMGIKEPSDYSFASVEIFRRILVEDGLIDYKEQVEEVIVCGNNTRYVYYLLNDLQLVSVFEYWLFLHTMMKVKGYHLTNKPYMVVFHYVQEMSENQIHSEAFRRELLEESNLLNAFGTS